MAIRHENIPEWAIDNSYEEYSDVHAEQHLVLDGLVRISNRQNVREDFKMRLEHAHQNSEFFDMYEILEVLNLSPHPLPEPDVRNAKGRKAIVRERSIINKAYPNYPWRNYSPDYIHSLFQMMPKLLEMKGKSIPGFRTESYIRRLELWLQGLKIKEIAELEHFSPDTIQRWAVKFPGKLSELISFYELTQAADYVYRAENAFMIE